MINSPVTRTWTDWLYPVNKDGGGWGYKLDGQPLEPRDLFAGKHPEVLGPEQTVHTWYLPKMYKGFHAGDVIWLRENAPVSKVVGAGVVLSEPWPGDDGYVYFEVHLWTPESRDLATVPLELAVDYVHRIPAPLTASELAQVAARFPDMLTLDDETRSRLRRTRSVATRQGPTAFREKLIAAYDGRCAISGETTLEALVATPIDPRASQDPNVVVNGLLLRADLRDLFDQGKVWIDAEGKVRVHPSLKKSSYGTFAGKKLRLPKDEKKHPATTRLARHRRVLAQQSS